MNPQKHSNKKVEKKKAAAKVRIPFVFVLVLTVSISCLLFPLGRRLTGSSMLQEVTISVDVSALPDAPNPALDVTLPLSATIEEVARVAESPDIH